MSTISGGPQPIGGTLLPAMEVFNPAAYYAAQSRVIPGVPSAASAMAPDGALGTPSLAALFVALGAIYYFGRRGENVGVSRMGHRLRIVAGAEG